MEKIFESGAVKSLQHFGERMGSSKLFSSITRGMMGAVGIMLVGPVCQILAYLAVTLNLTTAEGSLYNILMVPYNMTTGIYAVIAAFGIAYTYAKENKMESPLASGIAALVLFLMVAAPSETITLADGTSKTVLDTTNLGAMGLFTAIIIALVSVRITKLCIDKNLVIRMPDVVPAALTSSFSSVIPLLINVIIFHGINTLLIKTIGVNLPLAITGILSVPLGAVNSIVGVYIAVLFGLVLWLMGIHGGSVVLAALLPVFIQAYISNGALVAAGQAPVFHPIFLIWVGIGGAIGGTGCTIGLVLMGLRSKSEQIKAVSRAGLIPGFFNINEPVAFGMPTVYNPILAIPYILTPLVVMTLYWIGYATGFLVPPYIMMLTFLPYGLGDYLSSMSWTNLIFPFLLIPVSMIIYLPFLKVYERQLVAKEAAALAETSAEDEVDIEAEAEMAAEDA